MGLLTKIRSDRPEPPEIAAALVADAAVGDAAVATVASTLAPPPPTCCLFCSCPAVWLSTYDLAEQINNWRCCECDPPPGGWGSGCGKTRDRGGWQFVAKRILLVLDESAEPGGGEAWSWEAFAPGPFRQRDHLPGRPPIDVESDEPAQSRGPTPSRTNFAADNPHATNRLVGAGHPPIVSLEPPAEIIAAEPVICIRPGCGRKVLPELRVMDGGRCCKCAGRK